MYYLKNKSKRKIAWLSEIPHKKEAFCATFG